eukprot:1168130-Amphidinium_carterae.2
MYVVDGMRFLLHVTGWHLRELQQCDTRRFVECVVGPHERPRVGVGVALPHGLCNLALQERSPAGYGGVLRVDAAHCVATRPNEKRTTAKMLRKAVHHSVARNKPSIPPSLGSNMIFEVQSTQKRVARRTGTQWPDDQRSQPINVQRSI